MKIMHKCWETTGKFAKQSKKCFLYIAADKVSGLDTDHEQHFTLTKISSSPEFDIQYLHNLFKVKTIKLHSNLLKVQTRNKVRQE